MSIVKEEAQTLSAKAYEIIEELIATVELPPGTIFSEGELAARIGIGRTPLREALLRLSREHLIERMPRRGVRVTDINLTDQLALLEVRRVAVAGHHDRDHSDSFRVHACSRLYELRLGPL